jgi:hypothetical protein
MKSRQMLGRIGLYEAGVVKGRTSKKNVFAKLAKKKKAPAKPTSKKTTDKVSSEPKKKAPKDKTPLKPGQARNADTGRAVKISPAHQKNIDAYNAKKSAKSSSSVSLEEDTFTPKNSGK